MIYSVEQIKELAEPIAHKYKINALWIFGSYARGEPTEDSDIDFLLDFTDSIATNLCGYIDMANEFEQIFGKKVDIISTNTLYGTRIKKYFSRFMNIVDNERILLYEKTMRC
jgi:predicted nucleotidyltransferase